MKVRNWLEQPRRLFWVLQLGGWAAWGLIGKYGYSVFVLEEIAPDYGYYVAVITTIAIILSLGLRLLFRWSWQRRAWIQITAFLGGSFAAGYAWMSCRAYLYYHWIETSEDMEAWAEKMGPTATEMYEKASFTPEPGR